MASPVFLCLSVGLSFLLDKMRKSHQISVSQNTVGKTSCYKIQLTLGDTDEHVLAFSFISYGK